MGSDEAFDHAPGSLNKPEPAPTLSAFTPAWPKVIEAVTQAFLVNTKPDDEAHQIALLVVNDMRERDAQGAAKYGVRLQAGNGRRHLVDAYQENLDKTVYLQAWLDENVPIEMIVAVQAGQPVDFSRLQIEVATMLGESLLLCLKLRAMIKLEDDSKAVK